MAPASPRMLLVDDDPSIVRFLANRFAEIGFEVEIATDGLQAVVLAGRCQPDILVADVRLPKVDGLSLCECLARTGGERMVTIVISGSESREIAPLCDKIGASFARKGADLWATIEAIIAKSFPAVASRTTDPSGLRPRGRRFTHHRRTT